MESYAELVKKIRERKKWSQQALADALNVNQADIQRLEIGGRNTEKQFSIFMKLLPIALELGLIRLKLDSAP